MPFPWTLITVAFNSSAQLRKYWGHRVPSTVEWIVVDNGSTDDSVLVARSLGARVIELGRNRGFSAANNVGLAIATGEHIAFVNPDVTVKFADLAGLAERIRRHGGLISPQLVNDNGLDQPNGRGAPLLLSKVVHRLSSEAQHDSYLLFAGAAEERYVFWMMGAVVAGAASTFEELGGWDERYFIYYEDKDIAIRAWRSGFSVVLAGQYRWTHGWARETTRFRAVPWGREISSLVKFYAHYPEFLLGGRWARIRNSEASKRSGEVLAID
jgi:GT2 family glycosyltransferase